MAKSKKLVKSTNNGSTNTRINVQKTFKMFIGGSFPRTESGRFYSPHVNGNSLGNICMGSRKDVRNAIVAARSAQPGWAARTANNRGQILYRIAEMLEGRFEQFVTELQQQGRPEKLAKSEVAASIDRMIYFSGWCDKFQQVFSSVNPVASPHFNFSVLEPTGVVFIVASESNPLLGLVSLIAPVIASGNSCVVLASESAPLSAITFGEVLATSDVPGGVVNILTGNKEELADSFSQHLDVNAVALDSTSKELTKRIQENAIGNVKRVKVYETDWSDSSSENPYLITDFCEVKTTWHPIEKISDSGSGY